MILSTDHQHAIDENFFRCCQYHDICLSVVAGKLIWPLVPLFPLDLVPGKLTLGNSPRYMYIHGPGIFPVLLLTKTEACKEITTLGFFVQVHEMTLRSANLEITGNKPGSFVLELDKYFVKFLDLLGVPFRLYRHVIIGNGRQYLYFTAQFSR